MNALHLFDPTPDAHELPPFVRQTDVQLQALRVETAALLAVKQTARQHFERQEQLFAAALARIDTAIADRKAVGAATATPDDADLAQDDPGFEFDQRTAAHERPAARRGNRS